MNPAFSTTEPGGISAAMNFPMFSPMQISLAWNQSMRKDGLNAADFARVCVRVCVLLHVFIYRVSEKAGTNESKTTCTSFCIYYLQPINQRSTDFHKPLKSFEKCKRYCAFYPEKQQLSPFTCICL